MGNNKQTKENKGLIEIRFHIDPNLCALFDSEAKKERRNRGPHFERILEERYGIINPNKEHANVES